MQNQNIEIEDDNAIIDQNELVQQMQSMMRKLNELSTRLTRSEQANQRQSAQLEQHKGQLQKQSDQLLQQVANTVFLQQHIQNQSKTIEDLTRQLQLTQEELLFSRFLLDNHPFQPLKFSGLPLLSLLIDNSSMRAEEKYFLCQRLIAMGIIYEYGLNYFKQDHERGLKFYRDALILFTENEKNFFLTLWAESFAEIFYQLRRNFDLNINKSEPSIISQVIIDNVHISNILIPEDIIFSTNTYFYTIESFRAYDVPSNTIIVFTTLLNFLIKKIKNTGEFFEQSMVYFLKVKDIPQAEIALLQSLINALIDISFLCPDFGVIRNNGTAYLDDVRKIAIDNSIRYAVCNHLWSWIEKSKTNAKVAVQAAHAISLLNALHESFDKDLSGINIPNANLIGADFSGAVLIGANLANVNLTSAVLKNTNFADANLEGATLGELLYKNPSVYVADLECTILEEILLYEKSRVYLTKVDDRFAVALEKISQSPFPMYLGYFPPKPSEVGGLKYYTLCTEMSLQKPYGNDRAAIFLMTIGMLYEYGLNGFEPNPERGHKVYQVAIAVSKREPWFHFFDLWVDIYAKIIDPINAANFNLNFYKPKASIISQIFAKNVPDWEPEEVEENLNMAITKLYYEKFSQPNTLTNTNMVFFTVINVLQQKCTDEEKFTRFIEGVLVKILTDTELNLQNKLALLKPLMKFSFSCVGFGEQRPQGGKYFNEFREKKINHILRDSVYNTLGLFASKPKIAEHATLLLETLKEVERADSPQTSCGIM